MYDNSISGTDFAILQYGGHRAKVLDEYIDRVLSLDPVWGELAR